VFQPPTTIPLGGTPVDLITPDIDGDGDRDIVVLDPGSQTLRLLVNDGSGRFTPADTLPGSGGAISLTWGLLDADPHIDLLVADQATAAVRVHFGIGAGAFDPPMLVQAGGSPSDVRVADFNRDGRRDVVVTTRVLSGAAPGAVRIIDNLGSRVFAPPRSFPVGAAPARMAIQDFDFDTGFNFDVAVTNFQDGTVTVLFGDGAGGLTDPFTIGVGQSPLGIDSARISGTAHPDIAVGNLRSRTISVLEYAGDRTFQVVETAPLSEDPNDVVLGFFNPIPGRDVASALFFDDEVVLLSGVGGGALGVPRPEPTGAGPFRLAVADFNGDFLDDLASVNRQDGSVTVFLNADPQPCVADLFPVNDPDGLLTFFDLARYLDVFSAGGSDADLHPPDSGKGPGDGTLDFFDVAAFIARFNAGCP